MFDLRRSSNIVLQFQTAFETLALNYLGNITRNIIGFSKIPNLLLCFSHLHPLFKNLFHLTSYWQRHICKPYHLVHKVQ